MKNLLRAVVFLTISFLLVAVGCSRSKYTEDEFSKKVLQKPTWLIRLTVGNPDEIKPRSGGTIWIYRDRMLDTASNRSERSVRLTVEKGKVIQMGF
jgi:hypothetical protein